jgi:hypothetical protein
MKRSALLFAVAMLVPAATAAATGTTPSTPRAGAAAAAASIRLPGIYVVGRNAVTVPKRRVVISGIVRPYIPGQWVTFKARLGSHVFRHTRLRIKPAGHGSYGQFKLPVKSPGTGIVAVTASHKGNATMGGFSAIRRFAVLNPSASFGDRGEFVELLQARLAALHFYVPRSGVYDNGTGLAIDAYHRLLGWGTSQSLDGKTISYLLNGWGEFKLRFPSHGRHAEGNLGKQLLALADGSKVELIFPISSGKPSTPTVLGDFHVYQRDPGYLPDGMYYSSFFVGGYAIHGFDPAPDYPASHGCMRLPIPDAITAYDWLANGDWVDVYY